MPKHLKRRSSVTAPPEAGAPDVGAAELAPKLVGDIEGTFVVRAYQRGYRWTSTEVEHLLDDLHESGGASYYLQPIVVKNLEEGRWELIDGQQRLTTLFLLLTFMQAEGLQAAGPLYTLEYETRADSTEFLSNPREEESQSNIDFFHIFNAYQCLRQWFEDQGNRKQHVANQIYSYLFESVRVIWYEAPATLESTTLFTNLNIGRIPLTSAELVMALVLSRARDEGARTGHAYEIAAQWDRFEHDLHDPYVWAFATGRSDDRATRIGLLLDTVADLESGSRNPRPPFHTFETLRPLIETDHEALWDRVVNLHSLLIGWYENRNLFHKIGFLVADGASLRELVEMSRGQPKSAFEAGLDAQICSRIDLRASALRELNYGDTSAARVLLLANVETVREMQDSHQRFSFEAYASGSWSLEHIHAQNAEALTTAEQWSEWLKLHKDALSSLGDLGEDARLALESRIEDVLGNLTQAAFRALEHEIADLFTRDDEAGEQVDSISNLALLQDDDNSALGNSAFEVKRRQLLKRDREGSYIPVCTRNVFLKYFTDANVQQVHFWSATDRDAYLRMLEEVLQPYLLPDSEGGP